MSGIARASLFGRLNPALLKSAESATSLCRLRGNAYVELAHWLQVLVQDPTNDLAVIRRQFSLDEDRLSRDLVAALDALPRGATAVTDFSPAIEEAIEKGWLYASLHYSAPAVRSAHLLLGALRTTTLRNALRAISSQFDRIDPVVLQSSLVDIIAESSEQDAAAGTSPQAPGAGAALSQEGLARYSIDLSQKARDGEIDPVVGRDVEVRQMIDILLRRRQNNPILTGEAGVGKTAVVEALARRIAEGDVPPPLKQVRLHALDLGLLQAGASVKGEFERRLRGVIDEVEASPVPIILFVDEAHTLIGAGGAAGTGDAANLLKPALARGRLRTIAATTWAEYRQFFEKDPALTRRFQPVPIAEPDQPSAIAMLRAVRGVMEKHHGVMVLDEAIEAAVKLSQRYIPARQLPDKAISLLDTAAARVAVSQHATPAAVETQQRRISSLELELAGQRREARGGYGDGQRIAPLLGELAQAKELMSLADAQWRAEREAWERVRTAREARGADDDKRDDLDAALIGLAQVQQDTPMMFGEVDAEAVATVVGDWTGVPVGRMLKDDIVATLRIAERLGERVIGQDAALRAIAKRLQTSRAKLDNPSKPVGVFLACGPSGVGKTETALALSELLYAGADSLITINMSEFQEAHTVSTLKGAPAGYIGFGQGGVLTEAVRRRPYSVVLLDEVEKAHPDIHEMFFQVFDKGYMEDAEGRHIDFRNTLILLTSNVGTDTITALCQDPETCPDAEALALALRPDLLETFPPALLGRMITLPYYPLSTDRLTQIVRLQLDRVRRRAAEQHAIALDYDDAAIAFVVSRCTELASGGRMIDAILTNSLLPDLARIVLNAQADGKPLDAIGVSARDGAFVYGVGALNPKEVAA